MRTDRFAGVVPCLVGAVVLALAMAGCGGPTRADGGGALVRTTTTAGQQFLERYVTPDGRVLRHDQGDDVVSEGQAYAMVIAEAVGRTALVRTLWDWTEAHLQRPDGLLSWHATANGTVLDPQSATDADVLMAYALLRYEGTGSPALNRAGRRLAAAVLAGESVLLADRRRVLVAGPWARAGPAVVDPSYWMPPVFRSLGRLTGDRRWSDVAETSIALVRTLTADGATLPPDWASLDGSSPMAVPMPGGAGPVRYGLDAQRLVAWLAADCSPMARSLARHWWRRLLGVGDRSAASALSLSGVVIDPTPAPLPLLAAAAAATAAGEPAAARKLRERAASQARQNPGYYGDAWVALAGVVGRTGPAQC